jgi:hypothetical protein
MEKVQIPDVAGLIEPLNLTEEDILSLKSLSENPGFKVFRDKLCSYHMTMVQRAVLSSHQEGDLHFNRGKYWGISELMNLFVRSIQDKPINTPFMEKEDFREELLY